MSVFRKRRVFRDFRDTQFASSASIITAALLTSSIVFAGAATGATSSTATTGDASGAIVFGGGSISQATMEVSASGSIVIAGASVTGLGISTRSASGSVVFAGIARPEALATGAISFGGSATVGSTFTMDASGAIVLAGTVAGQQLGQPNNQSIVFAGSLGTPVLTDGTIEAAIGTAEITFSGTAVGTSANIVQGAIEFGGMATGDRAGTDLPINRVTIQVQEIYKGFITVRISGS